MKDVKLQVKVHPCASTELVAGQDGNGILKVNGKFLAVKFVPMPADEPGFKAVEVSSPCADPFSCICEAAATCAQPGFAQEFAEITRQAVENE